MTATTTTRAGRAVSVIITTSPVQSHPSLELLRKVWHSLQQHLPGFADHRLPVCIVCDGCVVVEPGSRIAHKRGRVTAELAARYRQYIDDLRQAPNVRVMVIPERVGFGWAVRTALRECVDTPLVLVVQHDYALVAPVPLPQLAECLAQNVDIHYIGFVSRTTRDYDVRRSHAPGFVTAAALSASSSSPAVLTPIQRAPGVALLPCCFWYDKTHLARRQYYLDTVFVARQARSPEPDQPDLGDQQQQHKHNRSTRGRGDGDGDSGGGEARKGTPLVVKRGDFIEDTWGHEQLRHLAAHGLDSMLARFGTYFWYSPERTIVMRHLHGRRFRDTRAVGQLQAPWRRRLLGHAGAVAVAVAVAVAARVVFVMVVVCVVRATLWS